jgi:aryl-alcohol dehydrogenase-like predicted oxidoreductase
MTTTKTSKLGPHSVGRIGFGAMQLAGPGVSGPPRDRAEAQAVLRRAVDLGVDHIDTAQYYGPDVVNELIRETLHPYPQGLRLVTKVGAGATSRAAGCRPSGPRSCAPASRTTCARSRSSAWTW